MLGFADEKHYDLKQKVAELETKNEELKAKLTKCNCNNIIIEEDEEDL